MIALDENLQLRKKHEVVFSEKKRKVHQLECRENEENEFFSQIFCFSSKLLILKDYKKSKNNRSKIGRSLKFGG